MTDDEREIRLYLKSYPGQYVSPRIISRRVGDRRRREQEPLWALPVLARMLEKDIIESDAQGHYRIKKPSTDRPRRTFVSPQVQRILERSSKDFSRVYEISDDADIVE